jgi:hypothetical protein
MVANLILRVALLLPSLLAAQAVRIVQVPERLILPAAAGSNLLLEVEVDGAASAVWLALDAAARERVALTAAGAQRWQLNLADAKVTALLPRQHAGAFQVHAAFGERTVSSTTIAWKKQPLVPAVARLRLHLRDGTTLEHALQIPLRYWVFGHDGRPWFDFAAATRIEVDGLGDHASVNVGVRGPGIDLPLTRAADGEVWTLTMNEREREHFAAAAEIAIVVTRDQATTTFTLRSIPGRLVGAGEPCGFVVPQRRRAELPGSRGWLNVSIDDITLGTTRLRIDDAEARAIVPTTRVFEREFVAFQHAGEDYVLTIDKLVNRLVGEDHAELSLRRAAGFVPDRIGQLVRAVGATADVFVRDGVDEPGPVTQQFLLAKLGSHRGPPLTVDQFVDDFAGVAKRSGPPITVRRDNGTTATMQEWLRAELARLAAPPGK